MTDYLFWELSLFQVADTKRLGCNPSERSRFIEHVYRAGFSWVKNLYERGYEHDRVQ